MKDNTQELETLREDVTNLRGEIAGLSSTIDELYRLLKTHGHEGLTEDGSKRLQRGIDLLPGQTVGAGGVAGMTGETLVFGTGTARQVNTRNIIATGNDQSPNDGFQNTQVTLEHQYGTDTAGGTHQSFWYGNRGPVYFGNTASCASGGTVLTQSDFKWTTNELAGAHINIKTSSASASWQSLTISSNTENTITVSDGTFSVYGANLFYIISFAIYFGSADYPWRRLYTTDGSGGGIRFGYGNTNGGQNALLYMDTTGVPKWRAPDGTTYQLKYA